MTWNPDKEMKTKKKKMVILTGFLGRTKGGYYGKVTELCGEANGR